jgi:hypothetical protein
MSSPDSETLNPAARRPLTIDVRGRRSERRLVAFALLALAIATTLLAQSMDETGLAARLFFVVAALLVLAGLQWHGWLGGVRRLTAVSWMADGTWRLADAEGKNFPATLSSESRAGSRWLWLRWHTEDVHVPKHRSMLLVEGDLNASDLRRLGVRLRLESFSRRPIHARPPGA